jgi:hypothetical protein
MGGRSLGLAKERLVPLEAAGHIANANDRPRAFPRISALGLTFRKVGNPCTLSARRVFSCFIMRVSRG